MAVVVLCRVLSPFIWSTASAAPARPAGRQLAAAGREAMLPTGLLFEPPVFVNQGEWGTGEFHTLDSTRGIVVGRDKSGWAVSTSGGRTWNATLLGETNDTTPHSGFGDAVVLPRSGMMHSNDAPSALPNTTYTDLDGPPTYFIKATPSGEIVTGPTGQNISYTGIYPPIGCRGGIANSPKACPLRTAGSATLQLPDGRVLSSMMGYFPSWGNENSSLSYALLAFVSSDGGYEWRYAGVIAANVTNSEEGPCENDLTLLKNGSVLCVFRTDGGDGQPCAGRIGTNCSEGGHRMAPYGVAVSNSTTFSTWLPYRLLPNSTQQTEIWGDHSTSVGSARPKVETMADGALLLAGGRPSGAKEDPMLWLNAKGDAEIWQPYSVSYWHNALINQSCCWRNTTPYALRIWPFDAHLNGSQFPRQSTSYNSLIRTNGTHGAQASAPAGLPCCVVFLGEHAAPYFKTPRRLMSTHAGVVQASLCTRSGCTTAATSGGPTPCPSDSTIRPCHPLRLHRQCPRQPRTLRV